MRNKNEGLARVIEEAKRLKTEDKMEDFTPKLRKKSSELPKPKNGVDKAAEMAKQKNNLPSEIMESSNKTITKMHTKVSPRLYFITMLVGLVLAIIGGVMLCYTKDLTCGLLISIGVGVFLIEFVDFKEAKYIENKVGSENGKAGKSFL